MKTIGLIGGLSWESTADYYHIINTLVKEELGGLNSAKCLLYSFNMEEIAVLQREGKWDIAAQKLADAAKTLETGGADVILICTNTMHKVAKEVKEAVSIPLIHIAESTARSITAKGLKKVGLLGTKFTMEQGFYSDILKVFGIDTIIPKACEREDVHSIIFDELCQGQFLSESKERYLEIIRNLVAEGAEGIILGCTEIPLLIKDEDIDIPLFNTTYLHSKEAVDFSFGRQ